MFVTKLIYRLLQDNFSAIRNRTVILNKREYEKFAINQFRPEFFLVFS